MTNPELPAWWNDVFPENATRVVSRPENRGTATRVAHAREAHRLFGPRAGVAAYCAGNVWLTENARLVGNL